MSGLYLLAIAVAWLAVALAVAYASTLPIKAASLRALVALILVGVLLPLPLIDEFFGKRQFEQLCRDNATIKVDRARAVGKTVYLVPRPATDAEGTWVRIVIQPYVFVDTDAGEAVVSYNELTAVGGRLVQTFGFSEGKVPLLFRGSCAPPNRPGSVQDFEPYGIKYIEPPFTKNGDKK